ncbi:hypothetical protein L0F63_006671 [Massospora cicadina]|nr:hypothetical protein L0F63_006671 [Massospora cicadina]
MFIKRNRVKAVVMISTPQLHAIVKETLHPSSDWVLHPEHDLIGETDASSRPMSIRLYSRTRVGATSLEYRTEAFFPDTPPEIVNHVYCDVNLRRTWDRQLHDFQLDKQKVCYIRKSPFPFRPRMFNYSRLVSNITSKGTKYHVVLSVTPQTQPTKKSSCVQWVMGVD